MTRWPSVKHFTSWLGLSPANQKTGGKIIKRGTKPSANRAASALRLAARSLLRSKSALGVFSRRHARQIGHSLGDHGHGAQVGAHHLCHVKEQDAIPGTRGGRSGRPAAGAQTQRAATPGQRAWLRANARRSLDSAGCGLDWVNPGGDYRRGVAASTADRVRAAFSPPTRPTTHAKRVFRRQIAGSPSPTGSAGPPLAIMFLGRPRPG